MTIGSYKLVVETNYAGNVVFVNKFSFYSIAFAK
jgi:hypothetical protein